MISLKKILVADDFSEHSEVALHYAAEFAKAFQADVIVCHVVEGATILSQMPPGGEAYFPPNLTEVQEQTARGQFAERLPQAGLPDAVVEIPVGKPFVEIVRLAKERNADLIILGTHGRGAIAHVLLGSVAEKVVRKAPCPVLTVRQGEHEFVMP
jgi:nucleotide-binding universal stress UspA family protein